MNLKYVMDTNIIKDRIMKGNILSDDCKHMTSLEPYKEANERNTLLKMKYGNLPSYAYWSEDDIINSTYESRVDWWKTF